MEKVVPVPENVENMHEILKTLPDETTREFEVSVNDFATAWPKDMVRNELERLVKQSGQRTAEEEKFAFALFAIAVNRERRMKNKTEWDRLLRLYAGHFEAHPFLGHCLLLYKLHNGNDLDEQDKQDMLVLAKKNQNALVDNGGAQHALAEAIILVYELDEYAPNEEREKDKKTNLNTAEKALTLAIRSDDKYAKYYCTYARLQSLQGLHERALANIDEAIDLEDETRSDYAIRIGQYQNHGQKIQGRMQVEVVETALEKKMQQYEEHIQGNMAEHRRFVQEKTDEYRTALEEQEKQTMVKNMEFLGLFSGIVSFTIGSLTITGAIAQQSIMAAAGLIIILMGALMAVFAGFGIILHGTTGKWVQMQTVDKKTGEKVEKLKQDRRNVIVLVMGILIVLGGLILCFFIPNPSATPEATEALTRITSNMV